MPGKTYSVPAWLVQAKLPFIPSGQYNPGSFESRPVYKPSGSYNEGGFKWGPSTHFRTGGYVKGGFDEGQSTFKQRDGAYRPGSVKELSSKGGTRPYNVHGQFKGKTQQVEDTDPYGNYYFAVELGGEEVGHFQEVSGIKNSAAVFEIEEGGYNHATHKRVGYSKWENLVLKRCLTASTKLAEWRDDYLKGNFDLRPGYNGAIILRNNFGEEVYRFSFTNAWPVSWEGTAMNSGGSEIAIETIEIAHDGPGGGEPNVTPGPIEPTPNPPEPGPINHDFDQAPVNDETQPNADALGEQLAKQPPMDVYVESHCSSEGSHAYNQTLSEQRAHETAERLRAKAPQHNYIEKGYSWDHPMAKPGTAAANRRTEVYYSPLPAGGKRGTWLK